MEVQASDASGYPLSSGGGSAGLQVHVAAVFARGMCEAKNLLQVVSHLHLGEGGSKSIASSLAKIH